jgi:hypothetical protein
VENARGRPFALAPPGKAGIAVVDVRRFHRNSFARGAFALGAIALWLIVSPALFAQNMLLETVSTAENSQPIQMFADHVAAWEQVGYQILLLRGNVVVSQGGNSIHTPNSVVWIDKARQQNEGVFHVVVYGEPSIRLDGVKNASSNLGYVSMATSNAIDVKPYKSKILKDNFTNDQGYQRALAHRPSSLAHLTREKAPTASRAISDSIRQIGAIQPAPGASTLNMETTEDRRAVPSMPKTVTYFQAPVEPKVSPVPSAPGVGAPLAPPTFSPVPPPPPAPSAPSAPPRPVPQLSFRSRTGSDLKFVTEQLPNGMSVAIFNGGVTLLIQSPATPGAPPTTIDIEADRVVYWTRGNAQQMFGGGNNREKDAGPGAHELYLAGNVEIRSRTKTEVETLRADEVYYDVQRHVAVARQADLEIQAAKLPYPIHISGAEVRREGPHLYKSSETSLFSSFLPSDPGLKVNLTDTVIEESQVERTWFWWFPAYDKEGKRIVETERIFTGRNMTVSFEGVPIFYFPYLKGRVEDPLGPLDNVGISYDNVFGAQFQTTWDMFDLLNLPRPEGQRWRLFLDYLTARGPGFGTEYDFAGRELFGIQTNFSGMVKLYGMSDRKQDVLGGDRGSYILYPDPSTAYPVSHDRFRGWAYGKARFDDLPDGFSVTGQFSFLSDRNFLEQFYLNTHLNDLDQDTYLRVKQQEGNIAWTLMGQVGTRSWMTETDWLPKGDFYWLGQTFLDDWLVYNMHANAGFARLRPANQVPLAYLPTDVRADTVRLDLMQELSVPFYLGPVKFAPYLKGDLAYYSEDVSGDQRGRLYGGGGVRWNMPLSRLYPNLQSDLFNVNQIYHKINLVGNYYIASSSSSLNNFPQLDRYNDDVSDQALRDIRPWQPLLNPTNAGYLTTSNLFNPQNYALRRLIDTSVDGLDDIHVLQLGINQRLQTKRGFPGNEHVIDWMTLNAGVSVFPTSDRDNFGQAFGILEYDWVWNIGDRTALTSSGFFEPWQDGPRAFDIGTVFHRPDSSNLYVGYRQIDPVNSKAVVASLAYPLSGKYAVTAATVWDFGVDVQTYSILLSRMGTDVMFNFGVNYNSTLNNFGVIFEILPNVARRPTGRTAGLFPMAATDPMR